MDFTKFQAVLDETMSWPDYYVFKFVVKTDEKGQLLNLLSDQKISEKLSKNAKYTSVTSRKIFNSAEEVVEVYKLIGKLDGIISL